MKIICKPRGMGKTTELIEFAYENDYYMIVATKERASAVFHHATQIMKLESFRFPITLNEFLNKQYCGKRIKGFVIDDADIFLQGLSPNVPIKAISITKKINNG